MPHVGALVGVRSGTPIAPSFNVSSLDGTPLLSDSLRGEVVLVNFWATWCVPCRVEMPLLERMAERHRPAGLRVLGFSVDRGDPNQVTEFVKRRGITYPIAVVGPDVEREFGGVRGYPTSFLLDRTGTIRHAVIGPLAPATLELAVRRLLDEPRSATDTLHSHTTR